MHIFVKICITNINIDIYRYIYIRIQKWIYMFVSLQYIREWNPATLLVLIYTFMFESYVDMFIYANLYAYTYSCICRYTYISIHIYTWRAIQLFGNSSIYTNIDTDIGRHRHTNILGRHRHTNIHRYRHSHTHRPQPTQTDTQSPQETQTDTQSDTEGDSLYINIQKKTQTLT